MPVKPLAEMEARATSRSGSPTATRYFAAKELTVLPGRTVTIQDAGAYGLIMVQGHGTMGKLADRDARR